MKNLDVSIGNQGILDESFSNALGSLLGNDFSQPRVIVKPTTVTKISSNPIPEDSRKVFVKPTTITRLNEPSGSVSTIPESQIPDSTNYPVFSGGGASDTGTSSEDTDKKEGDTEKMLFGFKAKYVYGIGILGAAAFVYFKFIKK